MTKRAKEYNADSIRSMDDIEHIRFRTTAYIDDTYIQGQFHIIKEIVDNATDELSINGGHLDVFMFRSPRNSTYQIVVVDNGRGIPIGKIIDSFVNAKTSGKFDTDSYQYSSGLFGIGSTVTMSLSNWFRVISLNETKIGDVAFRYDKLPKIITTIQNKTKCTGTIVMFEPDKDIFTGISDFMTDYTLLSNYLTQLNLFSRYTTNLYVMDTELPSEIRNGSTLQVFSYLEEVRETSPTYDSATLNRDTYIRSFFNISNTWRTSFTTKYDNPKDLTKVSLELYYNKVQQVPSNTKLTFVNNILFTDNASIHTNHLLKYIKRGILSLMSDNTMKAYVKDVYKLPLWLVMDVKFSGAEFAGMAKVSFKDKTFISIYAKILPTLIPATLIGEIYNVIESHIVISFNAYSNKNLQVKDMKHLLTQLNFYNKFDDCLTTDRSTAELLLVEGDSACSDADRNSQTQALYKLSGKPYNGLTQLNRLTESSNNVKKKKIFQDIIKITNMTPGSDDLSQLNFGKIVIVADADVHGYHITNIILGNLYALCPALITKGHVHIVIPPLYSLKIKGHGQTIYVKNTTELEATLAYQVYYRCIDITIQSDVYDKVLTRDEFVAFAEIINKIGTEIEMLSIEYFIPPVILEQLSLITTHLNLDEPNVEEIQEWLGYDVKYVKASNILILSVGSEDIIIPLTSITELIYKRILPLYRSLYYNKTRLFATTKLTNTLNCQPVSIVQLYEMFKTLKGMFTIIRNKGLGRMSGADRKFSCIDPATRRSYQVTSIGDVDMIYSCLGNDATYRKTLVGHDKFDI